MIDSLHIGKSKIRRGLLALFFTNPTQRYYLRELERTLGYSAGSIRRELIRFQEDRLFNTRRLGNLLFYELNTRHPLFEELRSIVFKTVGVEGTLKKALSLIKGIDVAFIYGSFASGKEGSGSDVDLMIIGDCDIPSINEKLAVLEKKFKREINLTTYSMREYKAKKKAGSGFILDLLNNPRIMLIGTEDAL